MAETAPSDRILAEAAADAPTPPAACTSKKTRPWKLSKEQKTCPKCGKVLQSRGALRLHLNRVFPCDLKKAERADGNQLWDRYGTKSCHKCAKTFTTSGGLRLHLSKAIPCDAPTNHQDKVHKCKKCQRTFSSAQCLRKHQSRVIPCDGSTPTGPGWGCKTCPKCHTTFSSGQNLRLHLNRMIPCSAEKTATPEDEQGNNQAAPAATAEEGKLHPCSRCQRSFATEQGLLIHMGRKKCVATSHDAKAPSAEEIFERMSEIVHSPEEQEQLKLAIREAFLKQWGYSDKTKGTDTNSQAATVIKPTGMFGIRESTAASNKEVISSGRSTSNEGDGEAEPFVDMEERTSLKQTHHHSCQDTAIRTTSQDRTLKRSADRSNENLSPVEKARKRPCNDVGSFADLVVQLLKCSPGASASTNNSASSAVNGHGGNIMTDGCCCRACVRKWTYKMTIRLEHLRDEVDSLRVMISPTTNDDTSAPTNETSQGPKPNTHSMLGDSNSQGASKSAKAKEVNHNTSADMSCSVSNERPEKVYLTENYDHLNEQIIINERALEDSIAYLKRISGHDKAISSELRSQIDELLVYINAAKVKRDEAVAAIITHRWKSNRSEFQLLLEIMAATSRPDVEKIFHKECAEIASQLAEKDKMLLKGMSECKDSGVVPKYAVQKIAKQLLERERDEIFMRLLRSSRRIYLLTKEAFN